MAETMRFEASPLRASSEGRIPLGSFSTSLLSFELYNSQSTLFCQVTPGQFRVPIILPYGLLMECEPSSCQTFLSRCTAHLVQKVGLQVTLGLTGGGSCYSRNIMQETSRNQRKPNTVWEENQESEEHIAVPIPEAFDYQLLKAFASDETQKLAYEISAEVLQLAHQGRTAGMRLAQLEDLPQSSIKEPFAIAKNLMAALHEQSLWSLSNEYLVRATIARLARRNMMDFILMDRILFESVNQEIKASINEALSIAGKNGKKWLESGVYAQLTVIRMLIIKAQNTADWWTHLLKLGECVFTAYSTKNPLALMPTFQSLWGLRCLFGKKRKLEFHLILDKIYELIAHQDVDSALPTLIQLLDRKIAQSWKNLYCALFCVEWAIHRRALTPAHIEQLAPSLKVLGLIPTVQNTLWRDNHWRVVEKVITIVIKLKELNMFTAENGLGELWTQIQYSTQTKQISHLLKIHSKLMLVVEPPSLQSVTNVDEIGEYVGREKEFKEARDLLMTSDVLWISGLAGIGKTAFASKLALSFTGYMDVIWKCTADKVETLGAGLIALSDILGLKSHDIAYILIILRSKKVLLLLDNVDIELSGEYQNLLKGKLKVILTTRDSLVLPTLILQGLDPNIAITYMTNKTDREAERADIKTLCETLSYIPLGLECASQLLIYETRSSVQDLLKSISNSPADLDPASTKSQGLVRVLGECVRKVSESGKHLLLILADLSPDGVPEQLYVQLYTRLFSASEREVREARNVAIALSLLHPVNGTTLSMHRLIQQIVISEYANEVKSLFAGKVQVMLDLFDKSSTSEENVEISKSVSRMLSCIPESPSLNEIVLCARFAYFYTESLKRSKDMALVVSKCCSWAEKNEEARMKVCFDLGKCCASVSLFPQAIQYLTLSAQIDEEQGQWMNLIDSLSSLSSTYCYEGKLELAEEFCEKALHISKALDSKSPNLATSYSNLSRIYSYQGKLKLAEEFCLKELQIEEAVLDSKSPNLATSYSNLSSIYKDQGKLELAEEFGVKALQIFEAILYSKSPILATSYSNLSLIYKGQGKLELAEEFCLKALQIFEAIFDSKSPILDTSYSNLSSIYQAQGKLDLAEEFCLKVLKIEEAVFDSKSPNLAPSYSNLSSIYQDQGKMELAKEFCLKALQIEETVLDSKSPSLATSYSNLSSIYSYQGKMELAEEFCSKALQIEETVLDSKSPSLAISYSNLSSIYSYQGKLELAEEFCLKALQIEEAVLDSKSPSLGISYSNLSTIYQDQGKLELAEEFCLKALQIFEALLDSKSPNLATSYSILSSIYRAQGKLELAEQFSLKALQIFEEVLDSKSQNLANSYSNLSIIYQAQGKLKLAEEFSLKALQIFEAVLDSKSPNLANFYSNLSLIYQAQGKLEFAEQFCEKALQIRVVLDYKSPSLAADYYNLSSIYQAQGKLELAEEFSLTALQISEAVFDPKSPNLATSYSHLSTIYKAQGKLELAEEFCLKALHSKSPSLATSYDKVSLIYQAQGKLELAEEFSLKALQIREEVLDSKSPNLATSYSIMSSIYQAQGKLELAEVFSLKALQIFEEVLDPKSPSLAAHYHNLSLIYIDQGKLEFAEQFCLHAVQIYEQRSHLHSDLAYQPSLILLIRIFKIQGKFQQAEELSRKLQLSQG